MAVSSTRLHPRSGWWLVSLGLMVSAASGQQPAGLKLAPVDPLFTLSVPAIRPDELRARDELAKSTEPTPLQFAEPYEVSTSFLECGQWTAVGGGRALWRLRVSAPGSTDLNFGFSEFKLPEGASLHIYNEETGLVQGPYTSLNHGPDGQLWTALVPGDDAVLELSVPENRISEVALRLAWVNRGYRNLANDLMQGTEKQGSCNVDVICPQGDTWRNEIRSVARYTRSGSILCTGTLIMNQRADFERYFLTAFHCGITLANASSVVVYWNYQSPSCGQLSGGALQQNLSGAIFRSRNQPSDFCLVSIQLPIPASYNVYFAGWDRSGSVASSAVCIHHPAGDEKAIAIENSSLQSAGYLSTVNDPATNHWRVVDWDAGTTEGGSSGSGLWDGTTHRIVGQLHGGYAGCGNDLSDWYGKLSSSWFGGGTATTQLQPWLDPDNTGVMFVDGQDPDWVFYSDATSYGDGWMYLDWLAWFWAGFDPWIYHSTHGWLYYFGDDPELVWFWDDGMSAYWRTSNSYYPHIFRAGDDCWLWYSPGSINPRAFWNYCTSRWEYW